MDTSEHYILMCRKAEEVQREWKRQTGDYILSPNEGRVTVPFYDGQHGSPPMYYANQKTAIWLPRQDQLQAMLYPIHDHVVNNTTLFKHFVQCECSGRRWASFEQAWLAFVMHQLYGKVWDGEKWKEADHD